MVVGGSQQETLDLGFVLLGTHQQAVSVILRERMLPDGFDPVSPRFTAKDPVIITILDDYTLSQGIDDMMVVTTLEDAKPNN
ncbi:unnamed protein product [Schistosoma margrebowiei]|uniref:Uncharacterized protein n=1 Tax=Schistosoma margrebowiei TaxID=48269 RepID=A0A183MJK8_9TREM|nr:unnamed protein product [Schistosoma margrebowiei]